MIEPVELGQLWRDHRELKRTRKLISGLMLDIERKRDQLKTWIDECAWWRFRHKAYLRWRDQELYSLICRLEQVAESDVSQISSEEDR